MMLDSNDNDELINDIIIWGKSIQSTVGEIHVWIKTNSNYNIYIEIYHPTWKIIKDVDFDTQLKLYNYKTTVYNNKSLHINGSAILRWYNESENAFLGLDISSMLNISTLGIDISGISKIDNMPHYLELATPSNGKTIILELQKYIRKCVVPTLNDGVTINKPLRINPIMLNIFQHQISIGHNLCIIDNYTIIALTKVTINNISLYGINDDKYANDDDIILNNIDSLYNYGVDDSIINNINNTKINLKLYINKSNQMQSTNLYLTVTNGRYIIETIDVYSKCITIKNFKINHNIND